ncbi:MAG: hypothetical protein HY548_09730, partial [Elusimicrobia bacterium]|nr:hypothetical protein [Elusimicrobiota bacterium]
MSKAFLLRPIPSTPSLSSVLPSLRTMKRAFTFSLAIVVFYSQVVCAGTTQPPHIDLPGKWFQTGKSLIDRLEEWTGNTRKDLAYVFHSDVYEDRRKLLDPGVDPAVIQRQTDRQKANMELSQMNTLNRGVQLPAMPTQPGGMGPEAVIRDVEKTMNDILPGNVIRDAIQGEIERIRKKMKSLAAEGTEFKYTVARNFDGTLAYTFMKAGKASSVWNERSLDLHGHTIIRNTAKMTYNNA